MIQWFQENWNSIFEVFSVCTVAVCAVIALYTWRKEFIGKKKIEFAAEFVEKLIEMQDFIDYVRNGFSYSNEIDKIQQELDKNGVLLLNKSISYLVPKYRIRNEDEKIKYFYSLKTKAYMYFGENVLKIYIELNGIINRINISSDVLFMNAQELPVNSRQEHESVIWGILKTNDVLCETLKSLVKEAKLNLEPLYQDKKFKWKKIK